MGRLGKIVFVIFWLSSVTVAGWSAFRTTNVFANKEEISQESNIEVVDGFIRDTKEVIENTTEKLVLLQDKADEYRKHIEEQREPKFDLVLAEVTAYTLGEESTGKTKKDTNYGLTNSGERVKETDKVIAAPPTIKFGTIIEVPGYGKAPVKDRGGAIQIKKDGTIRLDVLMETVEKANKFGRKRNIYVKVYH